MPSAIAIAASLERVMSRLINSDDADDRLVGEGIWSELRGGTFGVGVGLSDSAYRIIRQHNQSRALAAVVAMLPRTSAREMAQQIGHLLARYGSGGWLRDSVTGARPDGLNGHLCDYLRSNGATSWESIRKLPVVWGEIERDTTHVCRQSTPASRRTSSMALARLRAAADPTGDIRRVNDDPRIRQPLELLGAFNQRFNLLERAKLRLSYEAHFQGRDRESDNETDAALRTRLRELQSDPPLGPAPAVAPSAPSEAIARGLAILAGEKIEVQPDIAGQIEEINRQLAALAQAINEQTEIVDEIARQVIVEYAAALQPRWDALVVETFRAGQELARCVTRLRELRTTVMQAGICSAALRFPAIAPAVQLGSEEDASSVITFWRQTLEQWGML